MSRIGSCRWWAMYASAEAKGQPPLHMHTVLLPPQPALADPCTRRPTTAHRALALQSGGSAPLLLRDAQPKVGQLGAEAARVLGVGRQQHVVGGPACTAAGHGARWRLTNTCSCASFQGSTQPASGSPQRLPLVAVGPGLKACCTGQSRRTAPAVAHRQAVNQSSTRPVLASQVAVH